MASIEMEEETPEFFYTKINNIKKASSFKEAYDTLKIYSTDTISRSAMNQLTMLWFPAFILFLINIEHFKTNKGYNKLKETFQNKAYDLIEYMRSEPERYRDWVRTFALDYIDNFIKFLDTQ
jgi:hypothetical protein